MPILGSLAGGSIKGLGGLQSFLVSSAGDYESIQTFNLTSGGTGAVTFNSGGVWSAYTHLQVRWVAKCSRSAPNATLLINLNQNTAANYLQEVVEWDGTGPMYQSSGISTAIVTGLSGNTYANYFSTGYMDIYGINSTKQKGYRAQGAFVGGGSASGQNNWTMSQGTFIANTDPITSITASPDIGTFNANSKIALYGIRG